ncbi:MAG: DNA-directed RNA polymerase subunit omega [Eggerthellaceae bacterium]|nr:DNA-directed RNA polymerase subunit omega [Eggerthellaceae bacterium]
MSVAKPNIDEVLRPVDYDRFLACSLASKRAKEINEMRFQQRKRAIERGRACEVAKKSSRNSVSISFEEIADGDISYDSKTIDAARH